MRTIKFKLYALEILLVLSLFFALFALTIERRLVVMIILAVIALLSMIFVNKKKEKSIYERHVSILMLIISVIYLSLFYLLGLYYGYVRSKYYFNFENIIKIIIPTAIIIILSEVVRKRFLTQNSEIKIKAKKFDFSPLLVYISMTLVDLIVYTGTYSLSNLDDFLMIMGFILFSSLSSNLLFNYMSKRFGYKPIIIFRLFTCLYMYIIPYIPNVYIFLRTFLRMISPYIIYLILDKTYSRSFYKERKRYVGWSSILLVGVVLVIMLVSCQFKYGVIVVGSESMTGSINKGDVVLFERYDGGILDTGEVIIFDYNNIKTIHRIVDKSSVNGEIRYTTKGDSNKKEDSGYRTSEDIKGVVKLKVKYIGRLTLWFRSLFK